MGLDLAKYEWYKIVITVARPFIALLIWYIADRVIRSLGQRVKFIDKFFAKSASSDIGRAAIESRARTFRQLFVNFLRINTALFFIFIVLDSFGVDIKPLLAGIGVVGLGLSLAAQNILRDFISGMFILIENQFNVGDFITTCGVSGTVEKFTMRLTRIRLLDGSLVTIPNGNITQVTNSTRDWSAAVVMIGTPYEVPTGKVRDVLTRCAAVLHERMPDKVTDEANVQGIIDFRSDDVLMRMVVRTKPGEQWGAERALREIIRDEFEREGIGFAYPHVITIPRDIENA